MSPHTPNVEPTKHHLHHIQQPILSLPPRRARKFKVDGKRGGVGENLFRASAHVCKGTMLHGFKQKRSRARRCTLRSTARSRRRDKSIFIGISKRCGTYHRDWLAGRPPMNDHNKVGQNNQESRLQYWATRSSVCSFARTAHSLSLLHPARALRCAHSFARSLTSLTPLLVGQ